MVERGEYLQQSAQRIRQIHPVPRKTRLLRDPSKSESCPRIWGSSVLERRCQNDAQDIHVVQQEQWKLKCYQDIQVEAFA
jgi:hypothetical protein